MTLTVLAPVPGVVVALDEVPDPVFSDGMVGPGVAVDPPAGPTDGEIDAVAPIAGTVTSVHAHAFVITSNDPDHGERAVLVHLGLDTVQLQGDGFALHVNQGDEVVAGQVLVSWDPNDVEASGRHAICPVIALEAFEEEVERVAAIGAMVDAGAPLFQLES
ncbi:MAG TPA: PTS glucose transporter subunit IIA [Actinomycetales bacterium]|nr:PTS glucose transporter subunit IIA [Actinomycetales bacterium]